MMVDYYLVEDLIVKICYMIPVSDGNRARTEKHRSKEFEKSVNKLNYKNYKLGKKEHIGMRKLIKQSKIILRASGNERGKELIEC